MATRYLFLRSIRKLTIRFNPVLWKEDDKLNKIAAIISEIDEDLEDLIYGLVTHHESDRLSFDEFFQHPYVLRAMGVNLHASRMEMEEVEDDQYWDMDNMK